MKRSTFLYILVIALLANSCSGTFKTINLADHKKAVNGLIYSLPATKLNIKIEITEVRKQKGPFYEFLHLYFDTEEGIKEDELIYQITDVSIESSPIADPEFYFSVIPGKRTSVGMLNITPEGFLAGINLTDYLADRIHTEQIILSEKISESSLNYADFSLNSIIETKYDTLYKDVLIDSVMVKVPVITKKDVIKSKEKRAKEIADILFLLRDDRNALLKGENDGNNFPDGEALKLMVSELNTLEKQYMSLFTGRISKVPKTYTYEIIPEKDSTFFHIIHFSEKNGISDQENGIPLTLKLIVEKPSTVLNTYSMNSIQVDYEKSKLYPGLVYRIPVKTNCEIYLQNELLYKKPILISQEGPLNMIPCKMIKENISVEFYPETGSLKRISKIKE
jgi:hypothetical protein